jgi:polyhydroxyalkanoate synthesis regulator phasin
MKHATPEIKQAIDSGEMTINKAYEKTQKLRKQERGNKKHETINARKSKMERHFRLFVKELSIARQSEYWEPEIKQYAESCIRTIRRIVE